MAQPETFPARPDYAPPYALGYDDSGPRDTEAIGEHLIERLA